MGVRFFRHPAAFISAALAALFICTGCTGKQQVTGSVSFIIFGNTRPDSPFQGFTGSLGQVLDSIESRRTGILIHTGNSVYGGFEKQGITAGDVERQMQIFFPMLKRITAPVCTIPGESDSHNSTLDLYLKHSGRAPYYSFNYGSIHFITLCTNSSIDNLLDTTQMEWLKEDLEKSDQYSFIFVITHHPVFAQEKSRGKTVLKNTVLMELFIKHKVRAVFSGREEKFCTDYYGGVEYYTTGCGGYNDRKDNRKKFQYYIVSINEGEIKVSPEHVIIQ